MCVKMLSNTNRAGKAQLSFWRILNYFPPACDSCGLDTLFSHTLVRVCECVFYIVSLCVLGCEPLARSVVEFTSLAAFPASSGICRPESAPIHHCTVRPPTPPHHRTPSSPNTTADPTTAH